MSHPDYIIVPHILAGISIVDTPGILSGEKQRTDRGYDFIGVLEWFAERVDRILLLFDAHKLDISDEFKRSIEALRGHDDKIRCVAAFPVWEGRIKYRK